VIIKREWAMPNHDTFSIPCIADLILRHMSGGLWVDPFCRHSPFKASCITNDLDLDIEADFHMDALEFLSRFGDEEADGVLFDPPYSPRQISECYANIGRKTHAEDTKSSFYGDRKRQAARIIKHGGTAISFGWNSGGLGKSLGFEIVEILMVAHGGAHNDTICTVEKKTLPLQQRLL
jgi:hypothetical protein